MMFIRWMLGNLQKKYISPLSKLYPMVFSIHEEEIRDILQWMRHHDCCFSINNNTKDILGKYSDDEVIKNGLVSTVFEQYGNDGNKAEGHLSIVLLPSVLGTRYKIQCKCGEEFVPLYNTEARRKLA